MVTVADMLNGMDFVDWSNPVNWDHPLNRGLVAWYLASPNRGGWGSVTWRDLCQRYNGTLTSMDPVTDWTTDGIHQLGKLDFDATNDHVVVTTPPVTNVPCTIIALAKMGSDSATTTIVSVTDSVSEEQFNLEAAGSVASDPIRAVTKDSAGSAGRAATSTGYTAGQWHECAGVFASTASRAAFIDGGSKGTNTTTLSVASIDTGYIGSLRGTLFFNGSLKSVRIYSRALTDAEVAQHNVERKLGYRNLFNRIPLRYGQAQAAAVARAVGIIGGGCNSYILGG